MNHRNYLFKTICLYFLFLNFLFINKICAQVLIIKTPHSISTIKQVRKILFKDFELPERLFKERVQDHCEVKKKDRSDYDLIICVKKNGKLEFPVYNQAILKNSYQTFFNYFFSGEPKT